MAVHPYLQSEAADVALDWEPVGWVLAVGLAIAAAVIFTVATVQSFKGSGIVYAQKKKTTRKSGKEKANDVPQWAKGAKAKEGETPDQATERTHTERGRPIPGPKQRGPGSDWNQIKKYISRNRYF